MIYGSVTSRTCFPQFWRITIRMNHLSVQQRSLAKTKKTPSSIEYNWKYTKTPILQWLPRINPYGRHSSLAVIKDDQSHLCLFIMHEITLMPLQLWPWLVLESPVMSVWIWSIVQVALTTIWKWVRLISTWKILSSWIVFSDIEIKNHNNSRYKQTLENFTMMNNYVKWF